MYGAKIGFTTKHSDSAKTIISADNIGFFRNCA